MENRPVARESAKSSFFGHKNGPKKWCYFSRVRPRVLEGKFKKFCSPKGSLFLWGPYTLLK